ncbi:DDE-type integrase/transposase/recombinase [Planctomycetes bacterium Poly30]|uniref:DDE-type integrase/transposase/recombinase n=1 Tax=Saltatorellus ferox TaxID=2528018 RepID=UPI0011A4BAB5
MILGLYDEAVTAGASAARVCDELGIAATTLQRWRRLGIGDDRRAGPKSTPTNKLSDPEREMVIETCCGPEFMDLSPKQIVPTLADRGVYIASESTFHRILREEKLATRRGRASAPTKRAKPPEKIATGPCQLWSWDITYLRGPARGTFFYLYVIMDVWSRKIVGRRVHLQESSEHAATLIAQACRDESDAVPSVRQDGLVLDSHRAGWGTPLRDLPSRGVAAAMERRWLSP